MNALFYAKPVLLPTLARGTDSELRQGMESLNRRALELLHAAALIDSPEPGLLTQEDRETARRRGSASAKRLLSGCKSKGKPQIGYFRVLTGAGMQSSVSTLNKVADRVWILEDRCCLGDSYLRAVIDTALQKGTEVILCPSPLRRDRIEAVFLPKVRSAYLSDRAADEADCKTIHRVHLDRIPDPERRQALRATMRQNRRMIDALVQRAAMLLAGSEILADLKADTCTDESKQI